MIGNFRNLVGQCIEDRLFPEVDCVLAAEQVFQLTETSMIALDPENFGSIEMQATAAADFALRGLLIKAARLPAIRKRAHACKVAPDRSS
jgi:hypothetical protein